MVQVTLSSETSELLSSRCESTELSVLMDWVADPVDPWVVADCSMSWINQYYFKVFVG